MKIGLIGCGNMARAIISGILREKVAVKRDIIVTTAHTESAKRAQDELGVRVAADNVTLAQEADLIILAVKPMYYEQVISEITPTQGGTKIYVSIAPGRTLEWLGTLIGDKEKIARVMPNTPAAVGEGMSAVCFNAHMTARDKKQVMRIFDACGQAEEVSEHVMDAVVAVSGSSPAYVYLFIEAMADAAVAEGMLRAQAYKFAAQSVLGAAKMVLETGLHPGVLKDQVCSPGGTTIEAVRALEERGFRSTVIEAMEACAGKSKDM